MLNVPLCSKHWCTEVQHQEFLARRYSCWVSLQMLWFSRHIFFSVSLKHTLICVQQPGVKRPTLWLKDDPLKILIRLNQCNNSDIKICFSCYHTINYHVKLYSILQERKAKSFKSNNFLKQNNVFVSLSYYQHCTLNCNRLIISV